MPRLTRDQIRALIPHAGAMCLLDRVIEWDHGGIHCRSDTGHRDRGHPLRHNGGLASVHLIEYGAQAAAVHAGLLARESRDRPRLSAESGTHSDTRSGGVLAGVRDVEMAGAPIDAIATALDVRAWREIGGPQGMIYRFVVESAGAPLASGRLTIMLAE